MLPKSLRPMNDRILIDPVRPKDKTEGGIVIPDNAKERPNEGVVVQTGRGRVLDDGRVVPPNVKVGDKVLIEKYSGTEVEIDGKEYLVVSEASIIGVFEE